MNHKRGRARRRRAGCKLCKPWKLNGVRTERVEGEKFSDHKRRTDGPEIGEDEEALDLPRDDCEAMGYQREAADWELR